MLSNEPFRTCSVFRQEYLAALECFLTIAVTLANYWIIAIFLCLTCVRDFCEIFIFTTSKIVERVIWTLEILGFEQIYEKSCGLVSNRGVGTQTDTSIYNVTEQQVPTIKFNDTTVSLIEKDSQTSPSWSVVYSQDFTFLPQISTHDTSRISVSSQDCTSRQKNNTPQHDPSRSSVCSQDFTSLNQNNTPQHNLNMVEEDEKSASAIITVNDFKPSPRNSKHMYQSPLCTIHLTPCPTNLRAKHSKVLVDSMSPEEFSYLRRKWNNLRKNKKMSFLKMKPIFPSNSEDSSDERNPPKLRMMKIFDCDNKESMQEVDSPEINGCYKNIFLKLKSKFTQRNDPLVSYRNL